MTVFDPATKTYYEIQLDQMIGAATAGLQSNPMFKVAFENPTVAVLERLQVCEIDPEEEGRLYRVLDVPGRRDDAFECLLQQRRKPSRAARPRVDECVQVY